MPRFSVHTFEIQVLSSPMLEAGRDIWECLTTIRLICKLLGLLITDPHIRGAITEVEMPGTNT